MGWGVMRFGGGTEAQGWGGGGKSWVLWGRAGLGVGFRGVGWRADICWVGRGEVGYKGWLGWRGVVWRGVCVLLLIIRRTSLTGEAKRVSALITLTHENRVGSGAVGSDRSCRLGGVEGVVIDVVVARPQA